MNTRAAIEVNNLTLCYGRGSNAVTALRDVSFTVQAGQRVAIIGRSGGGKSSLMRVLSGLHPPERGTVQIGPHQLTAQHPARRELYDHVGLVLQNYGLVGQLSALDNVVAGGLKRQRTVRSLLGFEAKERFRARDLLVSLGLGARLHVRASKLSGGEQQRVGIARLLFHNPPVLLLDEPVASLDIHWANHAVEAMCDARGGESTVIMVLHDLLMVRQFADRVLYLKDGEIVFDGDPEEGCRLLEGSERSAPPPTADGAVDLEGVSGERFKRPDRFNPASSEAAEPDLNSLDRGLMQRGPLYLAMLLAAAVLYFWAARSVDFSISRVVSNAGNAGDFLERMFPPNLDVTALIASSLLETIQMALIGTTLAAILSLPIAVMAARNISSRPVQAVARLLLNLLRTVPSIIWGLFFVVVVGLGPFAGVLALTFYASGYLGKFYYEGIEAIDPRPLQSLKTVGASPLQRFRWGVFPQVLPLMLGYSLYMFEYNIRAASILGIVGAGGIGYYLNTYVSFAEYKNAATALLLLLVVVTIIDTVSSALRARLMD